MGVANEAAINLQKKLDEANSNLKKAEENKTQGNKKAPMLSTIAKSEGVFIIIIFISLFTHLLLLLFIWNFI